MLSSSETKIRKRGALISYINVVVVCVSVVCPLWFPPKSVCDVIAWEYSKAAKENLTLRIFRLFYFFYFLFYFANTNRHGLVAWQNFLSCAGLFFYSLTHRGRPKIESYRLWKIAAEVQYLSLSGIDVKYRWVGGSMS